MHRRRFVELGGAAGAVLLAGARRPHDVKVANHAIELRFSLEEGALRADRLKDHVGGREIALDPDFFSLTLADGSRLGASDLRVTAAQAERLAPNPAASRLAERLSGHAYVVTLEDPRGRLRASWRAVLRDHATYLRQELTVQAVGGELPVREVTLIDLTLGAAVVNGTVRGSPIVSGQLFFACEHPLADSEVEGDRARSLMRRELPLVPGVTYTFSSVMGTTPTGQLRRGFLEYLERERAHPYRTFLHYNTWYDLGYFSRYDEAGALDRIHAFGEALHVQRGVTLDSFLFDDGWDDPETVWRFGPGFPHGFVNVRDAAARYGAAPGVWMSPWGGYGNPKQERLRAGRAQGFETNEGGFALSGPNYYRRFRDTCLDMIHTAGVNQFKFDGAGNVNRAIPGSAFGSDFEAAIALIEDLRQARPDLYVNLTTGTYPSPFWLKWADSIWRGGEDHDFAGVGPDRQRWITYRDADTYAGIVRKGPLYPLSSLMLHGMIYAQHAHNLDTDPTGAFPSEVRAYFGSGTQLQEMYITPSLLNGGDWDAIAESARWSRANADVLADVHWVGGDPGSLDAYGWAAWTPAKAVLTMRNPRAERQTLPVDLGEALELPEHAKRHFVAHGAYADQRGMPHLKLSAGTPHAFDLAPFEVRTLELTPRRL